MGSKGAVGVIFGGFVIGGNVVDDVVAMTVDDTANDRFDERPNEQIIGE